MKIVAKYSVGSRGLRYGSKAFSKFSVGGGWTKKFSQIFL
jgi:hypothetical protein